MPLAFAPFRSPPWRLMPRAAACAALLLAAVAGCSPLHDTGDTAPWNLGLDPSREPERHGAPLGPPADAVDRAQPQPILDLSTGPRLGRPSPARTEARLTDGGVTLNFVNADVGEVLKAVLGDILGLNYALDPGLDAKLTLQTSRPLPLDDVLALLESVLQANGLAFVDVGGAYHVSRADAPGALGPVSVRGDGSGWAGRGTKVIPLSFASAKQLAPVLKSFVPAGASMQVDADRNVVIVSGTRSQVRGVVDVIDTFDVDWLAGMSFGLFPLQHGTASQVAKELEAILDTRAGPLAGVVRIVPLDRINAVLLASPQPGYIARAREWVERLDTGWNESVPKLYVYHVQNSRASDLAQVLEKTFVQSSVARLKAKQITSVAVGDAALPAAGGIGALPQSSLSPAAGTRTDAAPEDTTGDAMLEGVPEPLDTAGAGAPGAEAGGPPSVPRIVADEKNNTLVIYARPRDYRMIEAALKKLDVLPMQVLIEATIAEVTLSDELRYGLQWFFDSGSHSATLSSLASGAVSSAFPGFSYAFASSNARVVLNMLSEITDVHVLSAPQLMVLDHQTAVLQVGDEVPVAVQQARSITDDEAPIVNSISLRETGIILRVTPRVNATGITTLEVEQEVSDVIQTTTSSIDSPTIQQRRVRSVVSVADGETVALAGLIRDNRTGSVSGIPGLSSLPGVGALFGSNVRSKTRTELLILMTPRVVRNPTDARAVTEELRQRLTAPQFSLPDR